MSELGVNLEKLYAGVPTGDDLMKREVTMDGGELLRENILAAMEFIRLEISRLEELSKTNAGDEELSLKLGRWKARHQLIENGGASDLRPEFISEMKRLYNLSRGLPTSFRDVVGSHPDLES